MARANVPGLESVKKKGGWLKWAIIILIILAILYYLKTQGYIPVF